MVISKWGNSLAVRLPKSLIRELQLKAGDDIELCVREQPATYEVKRAETRSTLSDSFRKLREILQEEGADEALVTLPRTNRPVDALGD